MRWVAKHPVIWWLVWIVGLMAGGVLVGFLWNSDNLAADRIALVAAALGVLSVLVATVALKWTRDAVLIADRSLRASFLSEDMQRTELLITAIRGAVTDDKSPAVSASRLARALAPFKSSDFPKVQALLTACQAGAVLSEDLIGDSVTEVYMALEKRQGERAKLAATTREGA